MTWHPEWLQIAMDFALYSLQRQGDILKLKHEDINDGFINIAQEKTGAPIRVSIGPQLREVHQPITTNRYSQPVHRPQEEQAPPNEYVYQNPDSTKILASLRYPGLW